MSGPRPASPEPRPRAGWARSLSVRDALDSPQLSPIASETPAQPALRWGDTLRARRSPALCRDGACDPRPVGGGVGSQRGGVRLRGARRRPGPLSAVPGTWGAPDLVQSSVSEGEPAEPRRRVTRP